MPITRLQAMESLSFAVAEAFAATQDFNVKCIKHDTESVDIEVTSGRTPVFFTSPTIGIQLKATTAMDAFQPLVRDPRYFSFQLSRKNYEDLSDAECATRKYLLIVQIPVEPAQWIEPRANDMIFRARARWMNLRGMGAMPAATNSTAVHVPVDNIFARDVLHRWMQEAHDVVVANRR